MATRALAPEADDRDLYPLHEEDDELGENTEHYDQSHYLVGAARTMLPDWFITGNLCIYWEPGNNQRYRAPDLLAVRVPVVPPKPRVYLVFRDPPVNFVAEVGSRSSTRADEGPKVEIYERDVKAAEYLYSDPPQNVLRLWRRGEDGRYREVAPEANGRMRSAELGLEFGFDETGFLRIYTPDGTMLLTHEEEARERQAAESRAAAEARERQAAESRAAEAEARASEEARQRQELERQLAELRARLADGLD